MMETNSTVIEILEQLEKLPFIVHGSHDSLDRDIIYYIPIHSERYGSQFSHLAELLSINPLTGIREAHKTKIVYQFCNASTLAADKNENRNLIVIDEREGLVTQCFKGTPDAINNQLIYTWDLHQQQNSQCPIRQFAERNVVLKIVRSVRHILGSIGIVCHNEKDPNSFLRTQIRPMVRTALKSLDFTQRIKCLSQIDFVAVFAPNSIEQMSDYEYVSLLKIVAFQLVQTIAQFKYIEIYSKQTSVEYDTRVATFVYRHWLDTSVSMETARSQLSLFNEYRDQIVYRCQFISTVKIGKNLNLFIYIQKANNADSKGTDENNALVRQSNAHLIDMGNERCIFFPFDKLFETREAMRNAIIDYFSKRSLSKTGMQHQVNIVVTSSKKLYSYLTGNNNKWELFGAYMDGADDLILHNLCSATEQHTRPKSHKNISNLLNRKKDLYDWNIYFHMFAYDAELDTLDHILQRNQYSFKLSIPDEESFDDIVVQHTTVTNIVEEMNSMTDDDTALIIDGRLFCHHPRQIPVQL